MLGKRFIELTQKILLLLGEINRRFHENMDIEIADVTRALAVDTLAAQS